MITFPGRLGAVILIVVCFCLLQVRPAHAHAYLERSEPADNAILVDSPSELRLWYSEPVSAELSSIQVLNVAGESIDIQALQVDSANPNLVILQLPPDLPDGAYSILWKVLSTADGHATQGLLVFGVGDRADLSQAVAVEADTAVPFLEIFLRWLNYGLLLMLVGSVAVVYFVLDPYKYPLTIATVQGVVRQRILRVTIWCAIFAFLLGFVWLAWQIFFLWTTLPQVSGSLTAVADKWLMYTRLGKLWWAKQLVLLLLIGSAWHLYHTTKAETRFQFRYLKGFTIVLLYLLLLLQALTSHAAALPDDTPLAITADILHLVGASFWVGGLATLTIGLMPLLLRHMADFKILVQASWQPFGRLAALGVGLLIATGIYSLGQEVASVDALISTAYGRALILKTAIMLFVGLCGLLNATMLHPKLISPLAKLLKKPPGWVLFSWRRLPVLILAELSFGGLVLLLTAYITAVPTAQGVAFLPQNDSPTTKNIQVDDLMVSLSIQPNQPGANVITIQAASTRRPALAPIERVILRLTYLDQDFGITSIEAEEVEPGLYRIGGNQINVAGPWQADVVVRRLGFEDSVAAFAWQVNSGNPSAPIIVSNRPWEPVLTATASILLLLMVLGMGFTAVSRHRLPANRFRRTKVTT